MNDHIQLFVLMLAAHVCGDIVLYSQMVSKSKRNGKFIQRSKFISIHVLIHAAFLWIWLWPYDFDLKVSASLYILLVHFLIDMSRTYFEQYFIDKKDVYIFSRKDIFKLFFQRSQNKAKRKFLQKYLRTWLGINVLDQALHGASILIFIFFWRS